jgi:hypothetical protein
MNKLVNNFPREGEHTTVTRDQLDYMRKARAKMNSRMDYTIGGLSEARVHTNLHAQNEAAITNGERALHRAHKNINNNYTFASNEGRAKASFNHPNVTQSQTIKRKTEVQTYVERRRTVVRTQSNTRDHSR